MVLVVNNAHYSVIKIQFACIVTTLDRMNQEQDITEQKKQDSPNPVKPERKRKPTTSPPGKVLTKQKVDNMADTPALATADQVAELKTLMTQLGTDQKALRQSLESRIENTKKELNAEMSAQFTALKDEINMDIERLGNRMTVLEQRLNALDRSEEPFPVATTCVVFNLREERGENIQDKCEELINRGMGLGQIKPKICRRLVSKTGKTGIVKIQLKTKEDKEAVIKAKAELGKRGSGYERVFVRASQTHEERLVRQNTRTLLNALPNKDEYRVTMSGLLVKKDEAWEDRRKQRQEQNGGGAGAAAQAGRGGSNN